MWVEQSLIWWRKPWFRSVLLHLAIAIFLLSSWDLPARIDSQSKQPTQRIVKAVTVDEKQIKQEIQRIKNQAKAKLHDERLRAAKLKKLQAAAIKAKRLRQQEQKKIKKILAQKKQEAMRQAAEKKAAAKHLARIRSEQSRVKDSLAQLKTQEAKLKKKQQSAQAQRQRGLINKYQALIQQAIERHWLLPDDVDKKLFCRLQIRLKPGGGVVDVRLLQSSGNPSLDRSAIAAIYKASPLPVPREAELFDKFRELDLTVRPLGLLG